ncbi:MAG: hypothetical protein ABH825_00130 [Candidatus Omnitrophota bacterium]
MSTIIDILTRVNRSTVGRTETPGRDSYTQERLAETYLYTSGGHEKAATQAVKTNRPAIVAISALILLLAALVFYAFSTYAVKIDILINRKADPLYQNLLSTQKMSLTGASTNRMGHIILNGGAERPAAAAIDLKEPVDMTYKYLLVNVSAKSGGGRLKVILRDKNYRSYISNTLRISERTAENQNFIITSRDVKNTVDIRTISHIRLELEKASAEDIGHSIILLKKVSIIGD